MIEFAEGVVDTLKELMRFQRIVVVAFAVQLVFDVIVVALLVKR